MPPDDRKLRERIEAKLFTAVIGDVMDQLGLLHQFLPPTIRGLKDRMLIGRAMPVLEADCHGDTTGNDGSPAAFGLMFKALDDLCQGEVYVTTGASPTYALWGGLMSRKAQQAGAAGAVLDGFHRDTREILALDFPVFSKGAYAQDQRLRGRVIDFRCPIGFKNGAVVQPGDMIVGDIDGVLAIPGDRVEEIVLAALAKVEGEDEVRRRIQGGQSTEAIFRETGIM
ncbi:Demethylmenaquinone methyltransferase [Arboricoccus pini]|uniref:Putative 4-hydroxy-4-methyl-2-oxoglutarate aldolase n=1 Tax=Arboricoccus pini TaxID=1963835 RepID=A0A212RRQ6_9PROT|nr:RraA family protein [Arboricoccus pini]SNB75192.1 Demethylmenaquinone methyltransferase [Arboricoccus pini]